MYGAICRVHRRRRATYASQVESSHIPGRSYVRPPSSYLALHVCHVLSLSHQKYSHHQWIMYSALHQPSGAVQKDTSLTRSAWAKCILVNGWYCVVSCPECQCVHFTRWECSIEINYREDVWGVSRWVEFMCKYMYIASISRGLGSSCSFKAMDQTHLTISANNHHTTYQPIKDTVRRPSIVVYGGGGGGGSWF